MRLILQFIVLMTIWVGQATAHEVRPSIGDLWIEGDQLRLELSLNAEAFLAGIDLDGLTDTDESAQSQDYDSLRALTPLDLSARFASDFASLPAISVSSGGETTPLAFDSIEVGPVGDVELPRDSKLMLQAMLPSGADAVTVNWPDGFGNLILRQMGVDAPFTGLVDGGESSAAIPRAGGVETSGWQTFVEYIPVGFDHILPKGLDHILFVLGLFFLAMRLGPLLWQISAFTLAHTVTLALGALGWVNVPGSIVEPLIAASIVYVAVENILSDKLHKWRPIVVFVFGLLHGLGFASVLGEFGLPTGQFIPALIGFNIGVELGQLTVIAIAFALVGYWFGQRPWYRARIAIPASCVIALIGAWWVIERTLL